LKDIKWIFIPYAVGAVLAMCGIGVAIATKSFIGGILAILALILIMGYGFKMKKKLREQGALE